MTDKPEHQDLGAAAEPAGDDRQPTTQPGRTLQDHAQQPTDPDPGGRGCCGIVGIGASAGGLDALKALLSALPANTGLAFVVVPHLDPHHESMMPQLLGAHTAMPVQEARHGLPAEPNRVYVIPPGRLLTIRSAVLRLEQGPPAQGDGRLALGGAVDVFLRSLAADQQQKAIGIVLSGTGSLGTLGLRDIKDHGGLTLVQEPETAEFDAMPRSAIAAGIADRVLPPGGIAAALADYARHAAGSGLWAASAADRLEGSDREQLAAVLALLRARTKYDLSYYRKNMLMRRVRRRMGLCRIDALPGYLAHLREDSTELVLLLRDLLIGVTGFFRDPEAFHLLYQRAIEPLVQEHVRQPDREDPLRVWVPGCATGEEAYSIAMVMIEAFEQHKALPDVQIFATDLDEAALETARQGLYPKAVAADVPAERLRRFFSHDKNDTLRVNKRLREIVVFAPQNLITDAPFSRLDLISCRNLLIYLEPEAQQRIIGLFHFALKPQGFLFLGPSESVGQQSSLFTTLSKKWRLFQRTSARRQSIVPMQTPGAGVAAKIADTDPPMAPSIDLAALAQRTLLTEYGAAAVLIDRRYEILYLFGPTVRYLELPIGRPILDLTAMVRQGLRTRVRTACHKALNEQRAVTVSDARVKRDGGTVRVRMRVTPLRDAAHPAGLLLVSFTDLAEPDALAETPDQEQDAAADRALARQLENELRATREDLQTTIEELESANEELKASNEEAMSMNEELQSANEELETSKEELQSLNEELSTVNNQLEDKVEELERNSNDVSNLLASTDIATVFLDTDMRVNRFTSRAAGLLNLRPGDIGRPLRDLSPNVRDANLLSDALQVLDRLTPREQDVEGDGGSRYLRRIQPYRTEDNRIEGVVISFVDITERTRAEQDIRMSEARFRLLFERSPMCLLEQDWSGVLACLAEQSGDSGAALADWTLAHPQDATACRHRLVIKAANRSALSLAGFAEEPTDPVAVEQWFPLEPAEGYLALLDDLLRGRPSIQELEVRSRDGSRIPVLAHMVPAAGRRDTLDRVLVAVIDISTRKAMEQALADREQRLAAILDTVVDGIIGVNDVGRITQANSAAGRLFDAAPADLSGQPLARYLAPASASQPAGGIMDRVRLEARASTRRPLPCEGLRSDGRTFPAEVSSAEVDHLGLFVLVVRDMSERRALERQVIEASTREQQRIGQDIHDGLGQQLAAAGMMAAALARRLERNERPEAAEASSLGRHLEQAARDAKDIVRGLRPVGCHPGALVKALTSLTEQMAHSSGVACTLSCEDDLVFDDPDTATHLYRIAQEAINNAARHGKPSRIEVELARGGARLRLGVRDNGTWSEAGPDPDGGHGLQIMGYRAGILGGRLEVTHAAEGGTLVQCEIPWPPQYSGG